MRPHRRVTYWDGISVVSKESKIQCCCQQPRKDCSHRPGAKSLPIERDFCTRLSGQPRLSDIHAVRTRLEPTSRQDCRSQQKQAGSKE